MEISHAQTVMVQLEQRLHICGEKGSGELSPGQTFHSIKFSKKILSKNGLPINTLHTFRVLQIRTPVQQLEQNKRSIIFPDIVGLAITRPDCLPKETLDLLEELNQTTYLWIELGLQTIHERTANS